VIRSKPMEAIAKIMEQVPPFWPRVAAVAVVFLVMALPQARNIFKGAGGKRLDRAKKLLEVRKLQIDVDKLRAANPELPDSVLDRQIDRLLADSADDDEEPVPWQERLKLAAAGGLALALLGVLVAVFGRGWEGIELVTRVLKELIVIVPCAFIASAIPVRRRWLSMFYGFMMPTLIVAISVAARMKG
jgi:hypothetical protein